MTTNQPLAALFDLDGVVFDTERQYTVYWQQVGLRYHPTLTDFAQRIKGRTLVEIFQAYFDGQAEAQAEISRPDWRPVDGPEGPWWVWRQRIRPRRSPHAAIG